MTKNEWLKYAIDNRVPLASIIQSYHPVIAGHVARLEMILPITANNAEKACETVRDMIRKNSEGNPIEKFYEAIQSSNTPAIYTLLSDTWFGVPESTSCWRIEGFKELVNLLDDPPDATLDEENEDTEIYQE